MFCEDINENIMIEMDDKVFFNPGDVVKLKHDLPNVPIMYIIEKVSRNIIGTNGDRENVFLGMRTRWFSEDGKLQEAIFSTKDLMHV